VKITCKTPEGDFDYDAAVASLQERYGNVEEVKPKASPKKKRKESTDENPITEQKKVKKSEIVANEFNRPAAEAIKEMADIYFKNKDNRKGGDI
jgi:hypothetical protein